MVWAECTKPLLHQQKKYADIIIPWQGYNEVAIEMVISRIEGCLEKKKEEEDFVIAKDESVNLKESNVQ